MKGERIELRGFGVFQVKPRKRGIGRNPRTGKEVKIPPGRTIRFKPGKDLQNLGPVGRETDEPRVGSPSWPGGPRDASHSAGAHARLRVAAAPPGRCRRPSRGSAGDVISPCSC